MVGNNLVNLLKLQRITIPEIRNHEWFLKNLPADLMDDNTMSVPVPVVHSIEEVYYPDDLEKEKPRFSQFIDRFASSVPIQS